MCKFDIIIIHNNHSFLFTLHLGINNQGIIMSLPNLLMNFMAFYNIYLHSAQYMILIKNFHNNNNITVYLPQLPQLILQESPTIFASISLSHADIKLTN